jgi:hypothetical protein
MFYPLFCGQCRTYGCMCFYGQQHKQVSSPTSVNPPQIAVPSPSSTPNTQITQLLSQQNFAANNATLYSQQQQQQLQHQQQPQRIAPALFYAQQPNGNYQLIHAPYASIDQNTAFLINPQNQPQIIIPYNQQQQLAFDYSQFQQSQLNQLSQQVTVHTVAQQPPSQQTQQLSSDKLTAPSTATTSPSAQTGEEDSGFVSENRGVNDTQNTQAQLTNEDLTPTTLNQNTNLTQNDVAQQMSENLKNLFVNHKNQQSTQQHSAHYQYQQQQGVSNTNRRPQFTSGFAEKYNDPAIIHQQRENSRPHTSSNLNKVASNYQQQQNRTQTPKSANYYQNNRSFQSNQNNNISGTKSPFYQPRGPNSNRNFNTNSSVTNQHNHVSQTLCRYGNACKFKRMGKCKFFHPEQPQSLTSSLSAQTIDLTKTGNNEIISNIEPKKQHVST